MTDTDQLKLRNAEPSDCRFVWETNNHPSVRSQSINSDPIPYKDHIHWFENSLQHTNRILFIAENTIGPVGILRFDLSSTDKTATISIALTLSSRGKGYGRQLIIKGSQRILSFPDITHVIALIRPDNKASQKAFSAAGYNETGRTQELDMELLRYEFTSSR